MLILFLIFLSTAVILYFSYRSAFRFRQNRILATHLPFDKVDDPKVQDLVQGGLRSLKVFLALSLILAILLCFLGHSLSLSLYMTIFILWCFCPQLIIAHYFLAMRRLKAVEGWTNEEKQIRLVDTSLALGDKKQWKFWTVLAPLALYLLGFFWIDRQRSLAFNKYLILFTNLCLLGLFPLFYWLFAKKRNISYSRDSKVNQKVQALSKTKMIRFIVLLSWLACLVLLLFTHQLSQNPYASNRLMAMLVLPLFLVFAIFFYSLGQEEKIRKLLEEEEDLNYLDEDQYYDLFGYKNPTDPRIFVEDPMLMGQTINRGHKKGKIVFWLTSILTLALILASIFFLASIDSTHYQYDFQEKELSISADLFYSDTIPYQEIEKIELIHLDPEEPVIRMNGTSTKDYSYGNFQFQSLGRVRLYRYHSVDSMILIEDKDKSYLINEESQKKTLELYEKLKEYSKSPRNISWAFAS